ncbi:MAG: aminotransferase class III-fold pyridoxal phosphate-dependent enzyme [Pseudomonadota bacterium]
MAAVESSGPHGQEEWRARAKAVLPAGGFGNFDPAIVVRRGDGARVWDEDGKAYVDYLIGSGPMLVGHGHPEVLEAVQAQISEGLTFFASNAAGIELAEVICQAVPSAEQLRYVSTGSEADMYAMRLARAHTGRDLILKFEGGYHGMSGEALMSLSPERRENFPLAVPDSAGIPQSVRDSVLVAPFNDADFARQIIAEYADRIAGVIVEPLQRLVPPLPGFLETLRAETQRHGIVLIFDEVVTGFRLAYGGAQTLYGVTPDLTTLGKVIGGGFPLAAIAGKREIMVHFDKAVVGPEGFTFQVGTLSGNPVAAVAGLKTLEILRRDGAYDEMRSSGRRIMSCLSQQAERHGLAASVVGDPVLFDVIFAAGPVRDYRDTQSGDAGQSVRFNTSLRAAGVLKPPMKFYVSLALTDEDLAWTEAAIEQAMAGLAEGYSEKTQS